MIRWNSLDSKKQNLNKIPEIFGFDKVGNAKFNVICVEYELKGSTVWNMNLSDGLLETLCYFTILNVDRKKQGFLNKFWARDSIHWYCLWTALIWQRVLHAFIVVLVYLVVTYINLYEFRACNCLHLCSTVTTKIFVELLRQFLELLIH